jgi:LPS export ABC transporter protein LptC
MTEFERTSGRSGRPGSSIAVAGDRTHDYLRARRHSSMVRTLRWALPVLCIGIGGTYVASLMRISEFTSTLPSIAIPKILPENLTMDNPHYEGFGKDGSSYEISAKTAQQDLQNLSLIKLEGITGRLIETDKNVTRMTGARGIFNHNTNVLELTDAIDIDSDSGLKAKLSSATITAKEGLITSKEPVVVEFPGGSVSSSSLVIRQKLREATFIDAVKARLTPRPSPRADNAAKSEARASLLMPSGAPIDITAAKLDIKDAQKIAAFSGAVVAQQAETTLTSPELIVHYLSNAVSDPDKTDAKAALKSAGQASNAGKVSHIEVKGPVVMTRGTTDRVTSDAAEFLADKEQAILMGNVIMTSGADRTAQSDQVELDMRADSALLKGNVVVVSGTNELRGRQLFVNRQSSFMSLTAPQGVPGPARISARFTQASGSGKKSAKSGSEEAAKPGLGTFKTDPDAPVDIEADHLEANDTSKVAIFRGDVRVRQGAFLMRTPELQAHYTGEAGLGDVAGTESTEKPKGEAAQLARIEAKGKVIVTSKDGQTVTGDRAVFDAKTNTVTMSGDVVLTQGQNVVKGTRLVINMTSGESKIETAPSGTIASPGGGGWLTKAPDGVSQRPNQGRPSAVFYPNELKAMRDGGKSGTSSAQPPKGGTWEASTASPTAP